MGARNPGVGNFNAKAQGRKEVGGCRMLGRVESTLEGMKANNATKADLAHMEARLLRWQIGMWIATMVALLGVVGLILGR